MFFTSTRQNKRINASEAIAQGISEDGGLFAPSEFPPISEQEFKRMLNASYGERAFIILKKFLNDFSDDEILKCVKGAYGNNFENSNPAPVKMLNDNLSVIELWHGPTCAFKDLALQLLPYLLTVSVKKTNPEQTTVILVATSGDTGKAALEGFADVAGTKIIVFYPSDGVSAMQKLQMITQTGKNVAVCGIKGNFDDAQTGVKQIFGNTEMINFLNNENMKFSSANSINFGRLVPQIVYYFSAYCDIVNQGKIKFGDKVNIIVPTGNFGNILAAWYAKQMNLPVNKFICASNINNILTDFIRTGIYDRNRKFYTTASPSMDILISSNLERLLYHLYDGDTAAISKLMNELKTTGKYKISDKVLKKIQKDFCAEFASENETFEEIAEQFKNGYLVDPHTAVALKAYKKYIQSNDIKEQALLASTASPYKFVPAVLKAITKKDYPADIDSMKILQNISEVKIPDPLLSLKDKQILHNSVIDKTEMQQFIKNFLSKC